MTAAWKVAEEERGGAWSGAEKKRWGKTWPPPPPSLHPPRFSLCTPPPLPFQPSFVRGASLLSTFFYFPPPPTSSFPSDDHTRGLFPLLLVRLRLDIRLPLSQWKKGEGGGTKHWRWRFPASRNERPVSGRRTVCERRAFNNKTCCSVALASLSSVSESVVFENRKRFLTFFVGVQMYCATAEGRKRGNMSGVCAGDRDSLSASAERGAAALSSELKPRGGGKVTTEARSGIVCSDQDLDFILRVTEVEEGGGEKHCKEKRQQGGSRTRQGSLLIHSTSPSAVSLQGPRKQSVPSSSCAAKNPPLSSTAAALRPPPTPSTTSASSSSSSTRRSFRKRLSLAAAGGGDFLAQEALGDMMNRRVKTTEYFFM